MSSQALFWNSPADDTARVRSIEAALNRVFAKRSRAEGRDIKTPPLTDGEIWTLTDGEREILTVWILGDAPRVVLGDVSVAPGSTVTADMLWAELRRLATMRAWTGAMDFSVFPGDDLMSEVAAHANARRVATKMALDTATPPPAENVTLQSMTNDEFVQYNESLTEEYAHELFESGSTDSLDVALEESHAQMSTLLPDGLDSPGQHLWTVRHRDERVGILWLHLGEDRAFIYDIEMEPAVRGRGFGTQTLRLAAAEARAAGLPSVALNVFGNNEGARRLYAREGFVTTETQWSASFDTSV